MPKYIRSTIKLGSEIEVEVFKHPTQDEYVFSQTQVAAAIGKHHFTVAQFLASKWLQAKLGAGLQPHKLAEVQFTGYNN